MCFDVNTGYLAKMTARVKSEMGESAFNDVLADYRADGPIKSAHHVKRVVGGQPVEIKITEVAFNVTLPDGIFDLPDDVRALKRKLAADAAANSGDQPTLKRRK